MKKQVLFNDVSIELDANNNKGINQSDTFLTINTGEHVQSN